MCTQQIYSQMQSGGKKLPQGSMGSRLDNAQRNASSTAGGGTYGGTILNGTPKNTDVDAIRKTTMMGV
tara:strand:+ start:283 stop:486 length:204 start_codon:yes stop_codon:yes gene_type:complete